MGIVWKIAAKRGRNWERQSEWLLGKVQAVSEEIFGDKVKVEPVMWEGQISGFQFSPKGAEYGWDIWLSGRTLSGKGPHQQWAMWVEAYFRHSLAKELGAHLSSDGDRGTWQPDPEKVSTLWKHVHWMSGILPDEMIRHQFCGILASAPEELHAWLLEGSPVSLEEVIPFIERGRRSKKIWEQVKAQMPFGSAQEKMDLYFQLINAE